MGHFAARGDSKSSDCLVEFGFPRSVVDSPFGSIVVPVENPPRCMFVKFYLYSSLTSGAGHGLAKYVNIFSAPSTEHTCSSTKQ